MIKYGNLCRKDMGLIDCQTVMLSFMWCLHFQREMFRQFPEVLYVDGTHATNKERMPLLTIGVRDREFKMNVILRAFIPNEKSWLFRWIFQCGIPTLMGTDACKKVKLIVTDGDSQEFTQLDAALKAGIYGDAKRRRCGWHIIEKGSTKWLKYQEDDRKKVVSIMKFWLQESLMKNVERVDEYNRYVRNKQYFVYTIILSQYNCYKFFSVFLP